MRFLLFAGTRPEVIKLQPVFDALVRQGDEPRWVIVRQSRDLLDKALRFDGMDYYSKHHVLGLNLDNYVHPLAGLHREITWEIIQRVPLDGWNAAVVQGDTQTAVSSAMVCALAGIPVAHVEAGLRTHARNPWPEEMNRKVITQIASLHLAPTERDADNLLTDSVPRDRIVVTGQTGIDALHAAQARNANNAVELAVDSCPRIVVTCHRRENVDRIAPLAATLLKLQPEHHVIWPQHPNYSLIAREMFPFTAPMTHDELVAQLQIADLVITDSGGIIEEAAELNKPCLIIRDETERQDAIDQGCQLVRQVDMPTLDLAIATKLKWSQYWTRNSRGRFGDGKAAPRVAAALREIRL